MASAANIRAWAELATGTIRKDRTDQKWTAAERKRLREEYPSHARAGRVAKLAVSMGRSARSLRQQANLMGLTDSKNVGRQFYRMLQRKGRKRPSARG
jgi:hypothetical protein